MSNEADAKFGAEAMTKPRTSIASAKRQKTPAKKPPQRESTASNKTGKEKLVRCELWLAHQTEEPVKIEPVVEELDSDCSEEGINEFRLNSEQDEEVRRHI